MTGTKAPAIEADRARLEAHRSLLIDEFREVLAGRTAVYVDYPHYLNVGDWLIYLGALSLLSILNVRIKARVSAKNYQRLLAIDIPRSWAIILQGGGNFGDLYPVHQEVRRAVISRFPDNDVILMPQSVHFEEPQAWIDSSAIFSEHRHLCVYVRDRESSDILNRVLDPDRVRLAPDMAMMLVGQWPWKSVSGSRTLVFRRRDQESLHPEVRLTDATGFDWEDLFSGLDIQIHRRLVGLARLEKSWGCDLGAVRIWELLMRRGLHRAHRQFEPFDTIDADRLHGVLFGLLLGKKVIAHDNSYSKISRYANCWLD
ncbi:MAG TPA: polysaccharide pyruvyl transferase family protein [Rhodothermales bacterium]|nr:polysaccharide pyruvyl transferase family protein [Rhodothermales bacterium]